MSAVVECGESIITITCALLHSPLHHNLGHLVNYDHLSFSSEDS